MMTTPFNKSERNFRRYEPHIKKVIDEWPKVQVIDPAPLSCETFSCRFRDAGKSAISNDYWIISFDRRVWIEVRKQLTVSTATVQGKVTIGPYYSLPHLTPAGMSIDLEKQFQANALVAAAISLQNPSQKIIEAVLLLHHERILLEPSQITTDLNLAALARPFDVFVEPTVNPNIYIIT